MLALLPAWSLLARSARGHHCGCRSFRQIDQRAFAAHVPGEARPPLRKGHILVQDQPVLGPAGQRDGTAAGTGGR